MPRLLAAKGYQSLVDVYPYFVTSDEYGNDVENWDYTNPYTYRCTFRSLSGQRSDFGEYYFTTDDVKLEVSPEDARHIALKERFGNVRMFNDESQDYYRYVGERTDVPVPYYFVINGMKPQVDPQGRVVCVEVYGSLAPR